MTLVLAQASNVGSSILNTDCFVKGSARMSPFYVRSLVFLFLPLAAMSIPLLIFFLFSLIQRARGLDFAWRDIKVSPRRPRRSLEGGDG
jgi:hypothetical protein